MDIKDIKLKSGMIKDEVNKLSENYLLLEDDIYLGNKHKHNWKCKCGNIIYFRSWSDVRSNIIKYNKLRCNECKYKKQEERYKEEVEKDGEYEYIRSFRKGESLPDGKIVKHCSYLQIKHKYCGSVYEVSSGGFINSKNECSNCCGSYENSFAHHIEKELGEPLDKYWDFEKNTLNPYHIWKSSGNKKIGKIWIKCTNLETPYHGSYEINCNKFVSGRRCSYCNPTGGKVHSLDSFGQYLKDNNLLHLWSDKNKINPFELSRNNDKKIYMLCDKKDYHNDYGGYETSCNNFSSGNRCNYCSSSKVHLYDSFGQYLKDNNLLHLWSDKNKINPFVLAKHSNKSVYMLCSTKNYHNDKGGYKITCSNFVSGSRCGYCHRGGFASNKVHLYDSFGYNNFDKVQSLHPDNKISPFRVAKYSNKKFKFICPKCGDVFFKNLSESSIGGVFCKQCNMSKGEVNIMKWLRLNNIKYEVQKEYDGLLGVGNGSLSYDFYLPDYNLLIEYQGEQHKEYIPGFHKTKKKFIIQQEHDERKKQYAYNNNIKLLEIWYYDFKNINSILEREIIF